MTSYRHSIATIGLSPTVSEINGDFSQQSQIFPPRVFNAPLKGFSLQLDNGNWGHKTRMMGLPGRERSLTIPLAIWIQYMNVPDRQTDTGRQQRLRLRRAVKWIEKL